MINFSNNLLILRNKKNISQSVLADKIGVKSNTISNYETGNSTPNYEILEKLSNILEVSADDLLFSKFNEEDLNNSMVNEPSEGYVKLKKYKGIPLIPFNAEAGFSSFDIQIHDYDIENFFNLPVLKEKADFVIIVSGDSMTPMYENGSYIACKRIENNEIKWEHPYLILVNGAPMIKRLYPSLTDGCFLCRSDNHQRFRDFEIRKSEITSIAKILAAVRLD